MASSSFAPALRAVLVCGAALVLPGTVALACATTDKIDDGSAGSSSSGAGGAGGGDDGTICVLQDCKSDGDCGACSQNRHTCNLRDNRCVACDARTGIGCTEGAYCTSFGSCVPKALACPTDDHGVPLMACGSSADCGACDPLHQVCDTSASKCVACSPTETGACQANEICDTQGSCQPTCPAACAVDGDCATCSKPGEDAYVCKNQQCALPGPTGGACHDECDVGPALTVDCSGCVVSVCEADNYCCNKEWDAICVSEAAKTCGKECGEPTNTCAHPECAAGAPLEAACSACVSALCEKDDYCCTTAWDEICIGEVNDTCGFDC